MLRLLFSGELALPTESVQVHIEMLGELRHFELPMAVGPARLEDLLPAARLLIREAAEVALQTEGQSPSCRAGCGACCRQLVTLTLAEAGRIAEVIGDMDLPRRELILSRIASALAKLESAGLLGPRGDRRWRVGGQEEDPDDALARQYFRLNIPCPFLEEESCSIHPERPLVCREYLVTSDPVHCTTQAPGAVKLVPYLSVTRAVGHAARKLTEASTDGIPLLLVIELLPQLGPLIDQTVDGLSAFRLMLGELGETREQCT